MSNCFVGSNACFKLARKVGDCVSVGLINNHALTGNVVGVFSTGILILADVTVKVGDVAVGPFPFYWVNCGSISWFN